MRGEKKKGLLLKAWARPSKSVCLQLKACKRKGLSIDKLRVVARVRTKVNQIFA